MIRYRIPPEVEASIQYNRHLLSTRQRGKVAVDASLVGLWRYAGGRSLQDVLQHFVTREVTSGVVCAALACLAEAGLLQRDQEAGERQIERCHGALVSVVIVSYNSREWLQECLPSLALQTYSPIEIVVVDNGSIDESAEWTARTYPKARLIRLEAVQPFSQALNAGVQASTGDFFLLLNPDIRVQQDAIANLVEAARSDTACAAVGAKLKLWWAPAFLNGLGNRAGSFSWGTDNGLGHLDLGQFDRWELLPSACFAAALIPRAAWEAVGPVDEAFPMYYEDIEWSYRARLLGFKVLAAPRAVFYHAFGARVPTGEESGLAPVKLRNVVYGRLRFATKLLANYSFRFLRNYLLEDLTNFFRALAQRDWKTGRAYLAGWSAYIKDLPRLIGQRKELNKRRKIGDEGLFALQREMPPIMAWHGLPELTWDLIRSHYYPLIRSGRTRTMPEFEETDQLPHLLIVSHDIVDVKMAGPGMRYLELAQALGRDIEVTLAVPTETAIEAPGLRIVRYWEDRPLSLQVLVENSDVVLVSGYLVEKFPFLENSRSRLVVDLYDPFVLENLHYYLKEPLDAQESLNDHAVSITNRLARMGDYFICGNERQRDYWMGVLTANGRTNPRNFLADPTLRSLIDVVGIGFPDRDPNHRPLLRGVNAQVPPDARLVLWGGGIWNWLDPLTLIKAWPQVLAKHPAARLVFLGTRHPNPLVPRHEMAEKAEKLAEESGEKDKTILFFEWLSYLDRESLLCEADVGVTLHPIHVETRYSLRTRVLDYLWARLPVLITDGDITSEWIREYGLGEVVPPFDPDSVAHGLIAILDRPKSSWSLAFEPLRASHTWSQAAKPLLAYCLKGSYAPDRLKRGFTEEPSVSAGLPGRVARARHIWRTEGTRMLLHRFWRYIQWRLART